MTAARKASSATPPAAPDPARAGNAGRGAPERPIVVCVHGPAGAPANDQRLVAKLLADAVRALPRHDRLDLPPEPGQGNAP